MVSSLKKDDSTFLVNYFWFWLVIYWKMMFLLSSPYNWSIELCIFFQFGSPKFVIDKDQYACHQIWVSKHGGDWKVQPRVQEKLDEMGALGEIPHNLAIEVTENLTIM